MVAYIMRNSNTMEITEAVYFFLHFFLVFIEFDRQPFCSLFKSPFYEITHGIHTTKQHIGIVCFLHDSHAFVINLSAAWILYF